MPRSNNDIELASSIEGILSDVDGVLCDGTITYDSVGRETKSFHARDGLGIKLWMKSGLQFGIITARQSEIVARRSEELGIAHVRQNASDKWSTATDVLQSWNLEPHQVAYIGDDLPDLAVMHRVGLAVAPADAARDVREAADWVLTTSGGQGVVRELIERLLRATDRWNGLLPPRKDEALDHRAPGSDGSGC